MSKLQDLFEMQSKLMELLGVDSGIGYNTPLFKDILICMAGETHEALAHLANSTKPWKQKEYDIEAEVKEEVVDVLFFLLEAWLIAGWKAEELFEGYEKKYQKNIKRLEAAKS